MYYLLTFLRILEFVIQLPTYPIVFLGFFLARDQNKMQETVERLISYRIALFIGLLIWGTIIYLCLFGEQ